MDDQTPDFITSGSVKSYSKTDLDIIHVRFDEPGNYGVNLKADFEVDSIMLDTTFNVVVLDYIDTKLEIQSIQAGFYEETPEKITMYEGGTINFKDISDGNPNRRKWLFPGGTPSSAGGIDFIEDEKVKNIAVSYPKIGTYDLTLVTWRQNPTGIKDTLYLKDYINVVENIDPPTIKSITENISGVIHVAYDLPLKASEDLLPHFTLADENEVKYVISKVSINSDDNRIVDIETEINIKSDQTAYLSYDDSGGVLTRVNDIPAESFDNQMVSLYFPQNLANNNIYGFEDGGSGWSAASDNLASSEISFTDQKAATGLYSMRMEATENGKWTRAWSWNEGSLFHLDKGQQVTLEFKVWIDPSYTDGSIGPWIFYFEAPYPSTQFWTGMSALPRGEWITINKEANKIWTAPETGKYFVAFRYQKKGVVYIDDVKVYTPE
jgi:PKD repeat protein